MYFLNKLTYLNLLTIVFMALNELSCAGEQSTNY